VRGPPTGTMGIVRPPSEHAGTGQQALSFGAVAADYDRVRPATRPRWSAGRWARPRCGSSTWAPDGQALPGARLGGPQRRRGRPGPGHAPAPRRDLAGRRGGGRGGRGRAAAGRLRRRGPRRPGLALDGPRDRSRGARPGGAPRGLRGAAVERPAPRRPAGRSDPTHGLRPRPRPRRRAPAWSDPLRSRSPTRASSPTARRPRTRPSGSPSRTCSPWSRPGPTWPCPPRATPCSLTWSGRRGRRGHRRDGGRRQHVEGHRFRRA
jgi:hypothetical protein